MPNVKEVYRIFQWEKLKHEVRLAVFVGLLLLDLLAAYILW